MDITIRKAEASDCAELLRLLKCIAGLHHAGRSDLFRPASSKYNEAELLDILRNEKKPIFVAAEDAHHVCGYVFCIIKEFVGDPMLQDRRILYIDDLCVDEACRGQGLGKALMDTVRNYAVQIGVESLELNVWNFNKSAAAFYEHLGFTVQKSILELPL